MDPTTQISSGIPPVADAVSSNGSAPEVLAPALSIVVPTRNEETNVEALVERLAMVIAQPAIEVIFVDDSDDGTPAAVQRATALSAHELRLIHRPPGQRKGGLGGAVVEGLRQAKADWVCVMDADLQHPPEVVEQLLERSRRGDVDLVVASRFCQDGGAGDFGRIRTALSRISSRSAAVFFRNALRNMTDPMSGFFLVRRDAVDPDALQPEGFKILLEILVRTPGLRTAEVPFEFGTRHAGDSKASPREGARYLVQLWRLRLGDLSARVGRFGLVGASGLVVNTVALAVLADVAGLYYVAAAALATQASTLWNFALTEMWVFTQREHRHRGPRRMAMFFGVNNLALTLRLPVLMLLTSGVGIHYVASNVLSLLLVFVVRFTVADLWIWAKSGPLAEELAAHNYDIHGLVSVASQVRLPELERFRIAEHLTAPTLTVRTGRVRREASGDQVAASDSAACITYVEGRAHMGFGARIEIGERIEVLASELLKRSPHVLYTNVVEPILRWTFAEKGYALVHAACMADGDRAFLITARTDTGKTTTCLKALSSQPYSFLSDDLTLVCPDGRVLTYPKPLTISRHTLHAVPTPMLSRRERFMLLYQSRLHSRSGRRFAMILAKTHLPAATINALVQLLVPPPKYHVDRLIPDVRVTPEAQIAGMFIIQRGGEGDVLLPPEEALDTLLSNCEDAYGFPPYHEIEHFLHSRNGHDLRVIEREIISRALSGVAATLMKSENMDWHSRVAAAVNGANGNGGLTVGRQNGNGTREACKQPSASASGSSISPVALDPID